MFALRSFEGTTDDVRSSARNRSYLIHGGGSSKCRAKLSRSVEHEPHDVDVTCTNTFAHFEPFRFEAIDEVLDFVVTHRARTNHLRDVVEVDPPRVAVTFDELGMNG